MFLTSFLAAFLWFILHSKVREASATLAPRNREIPNGSHCDKDGATV